MLDELRKHNALVQERIMKSFGYSDTEDFIQKGEDEVELIQKGEIDYAVFTSASTVKGFAEATKGLDYHLVHAVCIGRQTKAAADKLGMITEMSEKPTMDSVVEKVIQLCQSME